jgi:hypothetical protein
MAARQQGEEAQGDKGQEESGAASVTQVVMPKPELPIAPVASVFQPLGEMGIGRQCSTCEQGMQFGKDSDEMSSGAGVQTKLTVGAPGDRYEQEADRVAAQVMRMSIPPDNSPQVQRFGEEDNPVRRWSLAQSITPVVHRRVDEQVQMRQLVQRAFRAGGNEASGDLESRLNASKGGGNALAPEVRAFMEPRFGADFSSVRVHTGGEAVQMNRELGAQAFAHGSDVYFGAGKSPGNNELTAHELTHVVQQMGGDHVMCQLQSPEARESRLPETNLLQTRPFANPAQKLSPPEPTRSKEQMEAAERFGYNAANISVFTPSTPPPVQTKGGLGNWYQPQIQRVDRVMNRLNLAPDKAEQERVKKLKQDYQAAIQLAKKSNKPEDWSEAAKLLNGFSPKDIISRLKVKDLNSNQIEALHQGALAHPHVGRDSNIAKFTQPVAESDKAEFELLKGKIEDSSAIEYVIHRTSFFGSTEAYQEFAAESDKELDETKGLRNLVELKENRAAQTVFYRWVRKAYYNKDIKDVPKLIKKGQSDELAAAMGKVKEGYGKAFKSGGFNPRPMKSANYKYRLGTISEHGLGNAVDIEDGSNPILSTDEWKFIEDFAGQKVNRSLSRWKSEPELLWKDIQNLNSLFLENLATEVEQIKAEQAATEPGSKVKPPLDVVFAKYPKMKEKKLNKGFFTLEWKLVEQLHKNGFTWGATFPNAVDLHHFELMNEKKK